MTTPRVSEELREKEFRSAWISFASAALSAVDISKTGEINAILRNRIALAAQLADCMMEEFEKRME